MLRLDNKSSMNVLLTSRETSTVSAFRVHLCEGKMVGMEKCIVYW